MLKKGFLLFTRIFYRLRQFTFAMTATMNEVDWHFVKRFLSDDELVCFRCLPEFEQKHSVVVAQKIEELVRGRDDLNHKKAVRVGLLHDLGKSVMRIGIIEKSVLTLIRYIIRPLYDLLASLGDKPDSKLIFRKFYYHKNHGRVGAEILLNIRSGEEIIKCAEFHDKPEKYDNIYMKLLVEADTTW